MITLPDSIKILEKDSKKITLEIKPLYPGYGVTLGNALRRVLLSSIEGAAITQVKIKGVSHEFSTIPGVKEDVLNILLNLKQIKLKIIGDEAQKIELKASGVKEIKAKDIKTPPQVEIINKDQYIASITSSKTKLEMEMEARKGLGYVEVEELKREKASVGTIYLDAIFSPIQNVDFEVENIRFEERTDYNKLKIEVETDGTVDTEGIIKKTCDILIRHLEKVNDAFAVDKKPSLPKKEKKKKTKEEKKITLEDLNLSTRTSNALTESGIKTLNQLLKEKEGDVSKFKGLGEKGISEIKRKLKRKGFELNQ